MLLFNRLLLLLFLFLNKSSLQNQAHNFTWKLLDAGVPLNSIVWHHERSQFRRKFVLLIFFYYPKSWYFDCNTWFQKLPQHLQEFQRPYVTNPANQRVFADQPTRLRESRAKFLRAGGFVRTRWKAKDVNNSFYDHLQKNPSHEIDWENVSYLDKERNYDRRMIKESLYIRAFDEGNLMTLKNARPINSVWNEFQSAI